MTGPAADLPQPVLAKSCALSGGPARRHPSFIGGKSVEKWWLVARGGKP